MSDFTNKVFNGFDANDMPIDPTMTAYADQQKITFEEAGHRFCGEYMIGQLIRTTSHGIWIHSGYVQT